MRFTMYIYIWHGIDDTVIQDILYTYMNTYITYVYIYIYCISLKYVPLF